MEEKDAAAAPVAGAGGFQCYPRFPATGFLDCLTAKQQAALDAMRPRAAELTEEGSMLTDLTLLRFLRARNFEVKAAAELLAKAASFRAEYSLHLEPPPTPLPVKEALERYYPHGSHGLDLYGRPMWIDCIGRIDIEGLMRESTAADVKRALVRTYERTIAVRLPAASVRKGSLVEHTLNIVDLGGLRLGAFASSTVRDIVLDIVAVQQQFFPEVMGQGMVVNAPAVFSYAWRMVHGLLGENTKQKIQVFGASDTEGALAALRKVIPDEEIPSFLGGQCSCATLGGCLRSDKGPWHEPAVRRRLQQTPGWQVQRAFGDRAVQEPLDERPQHRVLSLGSAQHSEQRSCSSSRQASLQAPASASCMSGVVTAFLTCTPPRRPTVERRTEVPDEDAPEVSCGLGLLDRLQHEVADAQNSLELIKARELALKQDLRELMEQQDSPSGSLCTNRRFDALRVALKGKRRQPPCQERAEEMAALCEQLQNDVQHAALLKESTIEVLRGKMHFYRLAKAEAEEMYAVKEHSSRPPEGV